ncbi:MAG: hypothetical protein ACJ76X_04400 [Solirubrobacteraceae bacterium]
MSDREILGRVALAGVALAIVLLAGEISALAVVGSLAAVVGAALALDLVGESA